MRRIALLCLILLAPTAGSAQVRVLFSHQSVGRYIVGDPERSLPDYRASQPIRELLDEGIAFWDHDYYNYWMDGVTNAILDPAGDMYSVTFGFGPHRGPAPPEVVLDHLLGAAFSEEATGHAKAFRDSCTSRFDIVLVKPSYRDVHMNTASSLAAYQSMLDGVSDWWHLYNTDNETNIILVVISASSLRHPSDYDGSSAGWPDTPEGHAEAEADAAAYRLLDQWLGDEWVHRSPYTRFMSIWSRVVNHTGAPHELNFTKDMYTGTGEGNSSGNHHLNTAGSDMVQAEMVQLINDLAAELSTGTSPVAETPDPGLTLFEAAPNPFNPTTVLSFELTAASPVNLSVYDVSGHRIATIMNDTFVAGRHQIIWNGRDQQGNLVSSGVYFYRIEAGSFAETKRLVLLK